MPSNKLARLLIPLLTIVSFSGRAQSQADQKKQAQYAALKSLIESRQYSFDAQSATTMKGRTIQLSNGYGLKLNKDSLQVDLPYYGRAYSTDYPPSSNQGIQFNSVQSSYFADTVKKGGWDITIKPKNTKVNTIYLSVSTSGYCTVRVSSSNRNPISYYGTIRESTHR
jgi:type II secretory pathway pseudopilin PulG